MKGLRTRSTTLVLAACSVASAAVPYRLAIPQEEATWGPPERSWAPQGVQSGGPDLVGVLVTDEMSRKRRDCVTVGLALVDVSGPPRLVAYRALEFPASSACKAEFLSTSVLSGFPSPAASGVFVVRLTPKRPESDDEDVLIIELRHTDRRQLELVRTIRAEDRSHLKQLRVVRTPSGQFHAIVGLCVDESTLGGNLSRSPDIESLWAVHVGKSTAESASQWTLVDCVVPMDSTDGAKQRDGLQALMLDRSGQLCRVRVSQEAAASAETPESFVPDSPSGESTPRSDGLLSCGQRYALLDSSTGSVRVGRSEPGAGWGRFDRYDWPVTKAQRADDLIYGNLALCSVDQAPALFCVGRGDGISSAVELVQTVDDAASARQIGYIFFAPPRGGLCPVLDASGEISGYVWADAHGTFPGRATRGFLARSVTLDDALEPQSVTSVVAFPLELGATWIDL